MRTTYELIDAGDGRRLERFGDVVVDRPAPTAVVPRSNVDAWRAADLAFDRPTGWAATRGDRPTSWTVQLGGFGFELRPTDSGQLGLFPEQQNNWAWLADRAAAARADAAAVATETAALNLFAYTGGSTLALASGGMSVAHVDASRTAVAWARRNAALSGLADRPVRWLVDDADAFVEREARRGRRYAGFVLDPPSYGHGPGGRSWRLEQHLATLLERCVALARGRPAFALLTAHTAGFDAEYLADVLAASLRVPARTVESGELDLVATTGSLLPLGAFARWPRARASHGS